MLRTQVAATPKGAVPRVEGVLVLLPRRDWLGEGSHTAASPRVEQVDTDAVRAAVPAAAIRSAFEMADGLRVVTVDLPRKSAKRER